MSDQVIALPKSMGAAEAVAGSPHRSIREARDRQAGMLGWLRRMGGRLAAEHVCAPPSGGWSPVPTHLRRTDGSTYQCPDCEQVFANPDRCD